MLKIWTELKNFAVKLLDFPIEGQDGVTIKTLIGKDSPVNLESEVKMKDVSIEKERQLQISLSQGKTLALVVISGKGILFDIQTGAKHYIDRQDFALIHAKQRGDISIQAGPDSLLRVAIIEVPAKVDYPLYRNR